MYALAGTMMSSQLYDEIEVCYKCKYQLLYFFQNPVRFGFGGKGSNRLVSLKPSIVQSASQAIHIGHPRSFNSVQNINSLLFSASRLSGPLIGLQHQLGFSHRLVSLVMRFYNKITPNLYNIYINIIIISVFISALNLERRS